MANDAETLTSNATANGISSSSDSDDNTPLAALKNQLSSTSLKSNSSPSSSKENHSPRKVNHTESASSDDDKPLALLQPKFKKQKLQQQTLFDMANKGKIKFSNGNGKIKKRNVKPKVPSIVLKALKMQKLATQNPEDKNMAAQYGRMIGQIVKTLEKSQISEITNTRMKEDISIKAEKNRIDALPLEERKKFYLDKRREKYKADKDKAEKDKADKAAKMVDDWTLQGTPLVYKSLKKLSSSKELLEDYLQLPLVHCHLFPDLICSYQFICSYAGYLAMPSMNAADIRKILLRDWVAALLKKDNKSINNMKQLIFALIRTKIVKHKTKLPELKAYGIDMESLNVKKHINPTLCSYLLYSFIKYRFDEIKNFEADIRREKAKREAQRKKDEADREWREMVDDDDSGDEIAPPPLPVNDAASESDVEFKENQEHQSDQYGQILSILDTFNKDYFGLDIEDKLCIIKLLISEHVSSPELRDFQENHENFLKISRQDVRDCKKEHNTLKQEFSAFNTEAAEGKAEATEVPPQTFYKSKRVEDAQRTKQRDKMQRDMDNLVQEIESIEGTIAELEEHSSTIVRIESLGSDRHRRTHWLFDGLPILIEQPSYIQQSGQIMTTVWYFISDKEEYLTTANTTISDCGMRESLLRTEILASAESIESSYKKYREVINPKEEESSDEDESDDQPIQNYDPQSKILCHLRSFMEKIERTNQINLKRCLGLDDDDERESFIEEILCSCTDSTYSLPELLGKFHNHTFTKCLTNTLSQKEYQQKFLEQCANVKARDFSTVAFLLYLMESSLSGSVSRRGRRMCNSDLTVMEKHLDDEKEAAKMQVEEESEEEPESSSEQEESDQEEKTTTRSGRQTRVAVYDEVNFDEDGDAIVRKTYAKKDPEKKKNERKNKTSSTRGRKKRTCKEPIYNEVRRSSRRNTHTTYNEKSSSAETSDEDRTWEDDPADLDDFVSSRRR